MEDEYKQVFQTMCKRTFLLLDSVGLGIILLSVLAGMYFHKYDDLHKYEVIIHSIGTTIGAAILTIGISLPVAIYYQTQHNERAFKIIKACDESKIDSIFVSRLKDKNDIQNAIDKAAKTTSNEIILLGIAFPSLFDPSEAHTSYIADKVQEPSFNMRILLLNPNSAAARRREIIERGHQTINQIKHTLDDNIVATVTERFKNLLSKHDELKNKIALMCNDSAKLNNIKSILSEHNKIKLRLYEFDPIAFLMGFDECLFTEQYHFGNPEGKVPSRSCIGKRIPVIQYNKDSDAYAFYKSHFEYVWQNSEEYTNEIISSSIDDICHWLSSSSNISNKQETA